ESDGRAIRLRLSAGGQATRDAILRQDIRNAAAMLQTLDESERDAFVATMGRVASGLSAFADEEENTNARPGLKARSSA
ncbi:MAG: hypothetical protein AAFY59_19590, partial [Pseudomonadota bacterium]